MIAKPARELSRFWFAARPRVRIGLAALAAVALGAGLVCARSGGGGPEDHAVRLVPAGALAYVHVATDRGREPDRRLERLAAQLPPLGRLRDRLAGAISAHALD